VDLTGALREERGRRRSQQLLDSGGILRQQIQRREREFRLGPDFQARGLRR